MRKILYCILICSALCSCSLSVPQEHERNIFAMDTVMQLRIYGGSEDTANAAEEEIYRLDTLLDRGDENSEIFKINRDKSCQIDAETEALINDALAISELTDGAFDITVAHVMDLWGFYSQDYHIPDETSLSETLDGVGFKKISVKNGMISIPDNTGIDLGGIAKGYASDRVASILRDKGIQSAIISLGGNVYAFGLKPDGSEWSVGIADPFYPSQTIGRLKVADKAIITSGAYQRYFEQDGARYHHIIDPKTGKSANSGLSSVTVISESGTIADGLSTALYVMGLDEACELWRENKDFDLVLVDDNGNIYITEGIEYSFDCKQEVTVIR